MKSGLTVTNPSSMIQSTSHNDGAAQAKALAAAAAAAPLRPASARDRLSTDSADRLHALLRAEPEVRADVVARGRALAADSAYPSPETVRGIAAQLLASPDPADDAG